VHAQQGLRRQQIRLRQPAVVALPGGRGKTAVGDRVELTRPGSLRERVPVTQKIRLDGGKRRVGQSGERGGGRGGHQGFTARDFTAGDVTAGWRYGAAGMMLRMVHRRRRACQSGIPSSPQKKPHK